jgi:outer membrane protein TolC
MRYGTLALLALPALTGCATIREARTVQRQTGAGLPAGERTVTVAELGLAGRPRLELDRAVAVSLAWHPSLAIATQAVVAARLAVHQAGVPLRPSLSASAGYSGKTSGADQTDWNFESDDALNLGLNLTWMIYDFGQTRASRRAAVADYLAAAESYRGTVVERVGAVRSAYFALAQAEALAAVKAGSLDQFALLLLQAELKLKVGSGRKYDVTKARVDCSNAELELTVASNAIFTARATLNNELGLAEHAVFDLNPATTLPAPPEALDDLLVLARTNQPALKVAQAKVAAATAAVDAAVAGLYPSLSVSASSSYAASTPQTAAGSWGLSLIHSLFGGWNQQDAVKQRVVQLRDARAAFARQEQQTVLALATAHANLNSAQERQTTSDRLVAQTQENLDLVLRQYAVGLSSVLERSDAQLAFTQAKANQIDAIYGVERSRAEIFAILGVVEGGQ